jgi:[acyl-carrier-protein] S-malonyltransferase
MFYSISRKLVSYGPRRAFSNNRSTIPPPFVSPDKAKAALDDAANRDHRVSGDQIKWRTSTFHEFDEAKELLNRPKRPKRKVNAPPPPISSRDDSQGTILLFPGQGAQFVGMGQKVLDVAPSTKDLFQNASQILGYDLLKVCLEGPKETLDSTKYCQPAILVSSLAAVESLWELDSDSVKNCVATAGFSVGEITALVFSGALTFEDGVRLVHNRAEAMQTASEMENSGMMTVFYHKDANLGLACEAARKYTTEQHHIREPICQIANHLYAGAKVLAGNMECLQFVERNKSDFGIRRVKKIPVSGAFHTPIMTPAVDAFTEALHLSSVMDPRIPVYSNVDCIVYRDAAMIRKTLPKQIVTSVKWEQTINNMLRYVHDGYWPRVIECGPGTSLTSMLKNVNGKWSKRATAVPV